MNYFNLNNTYTVIDIGTTKICAIIAQKINNDINIIGSGVSYSDGLSKGVVVDIEKTAKSIKNALNEAMSMSSFEPESVTIGISGYHIKSYYSQGMTSVRNGIIRKETIDEVLSASKTISLSDDQEIIHVIPVSYIIDNSLKVQNPIGMHGVRLEVISHIITANINSIKDLIHSCSLAGLKTEDVVLEPIASSFSILNNEEKNIGSILIDIGGGTTDVAFYKNGALNYTEIISIAGNTFTNDLSICLKTSFEEAERIKRDANILDLNNSDVVLIKLIDGIDKIDVDKIIINEILRCRADELINIINNGIRNYSSIYNIPSGIVLTGGGSLLAGMKELISKTTGLSTRIGIPVINSSFKDQLEHPSFSTSYGLLLYAIDKNFQKDIDIKDSFVSKFFWRVKSLINKIIL